MRFSLGLFDSHILLGIGLIIAVMAVALLSIYLASKRLRQNKPRFILVVVANLFLAAAVVGLAANLQINTSKANTIYLITAGAQAEQLKDIDSSQVIYVLHKPSGTLAGALAKYPNIQLDSVSQLIDAQTNIQNIQIIGSGLSAQQWQDLEVLLEDRLSSSNITHLPAEPILGLVNVKWQKQSVEGQFIQLSGQLTGVEAQPNAIYELSLINPIGEEIQSLRLKAQEDFNFNFAAKIVGQWVYKLQLKQANQSPPIITEPVAFNVRPASLVKVLIKQASPSFETRQLTNWASEFNTKMTVLTQISKNKDIRQNFNFTAQELAELNTPLDKNALNNFDLLLIDGRSLLALSNEQMQDLEAAVKSGLGLYIMLDQSLIDAWQPPFLGWLPKIGIKPLNTATYSAIPQWQNSKIEQSIALVKAELSVLQGDIIVSSHLAQPLVSNTSLGMGQVAISLINRTYSWQTAGLSSEYSHYWQHILSHLSRQQTQPYWLEPSETQLEFVQQRYQACLIADLRDKSLTHSVNNQQQTLLAIPKAFQSEQSCVTTWLTLSGWHHLQVSTDKGNPNQSSTSSIYAYNQTDWQAYSQAQNVRLTQQKIAKLTGSTVNRTQYQDLPKAWFWWCLVIAGSLLWLERKTFS